MDESDYKEFIYDICDFMTRTANFKEKINREGICDHEIVGFVHGIRWCVSCIKSNINLIEGRKNNEDEYIRPEERTCAIDNTIANK